MSRFVIRFIAAFALLLLPLFAEAHIGSPTVFYEGNAGPYPVRVVIRPPGVIPGLAEISVRVKRDGPHEVTVLPLHWKSARDGAPTPDRAVLVRGETNLHSAQLWFMVPGAQSVEVSVRGAAGKGTILVPVNAVATNVLTMPRHLGITLSVLGGLLVLLTASIAGAAIRESVLPSGAKPSVRRRLLARAGMVTALVCISGFLWFGKLWWESEANDYRNNRLFRPSDTDTELVRSGETSTLRLKYSVEQMRKNGPLVPDHGKLMHLFVMREPDLTAFAHLHPRKIDWQTFETGLPELPPGTYTLYGDVTYETGLADTLTTQFTIPGSVRTATDLDPDDSWSRQPPVGSALGPESQLGDHSIVRLSAGSVEPNRETQLRFGVMSADGKPAKLESYMGMRGHLVVRHEDGTVFTHLHPTGSFSMAAQQLFEMRIAGKAPLKVASYTNDPLCRLPLVSVSESEGADNQITFPYEFPKPGRYRVWVQAKVSGRIVTSAFDLNVRQSAEANANRGTPFS